MTAEDANRGDVAASITELQRLLLATSGVEEFLDELVVLAARTVHDQVSCGVTVQSGGSATTVASSDARARQVDEVQYQLEDGPCLRAMRTGETLYVEDTSGPESWGGYSPRAAANGIGSSYSLPLAAEEITGAMNFYATSAHAFGNAEIRRAEQFAAGASAALALSARQASSAQLSTQLQEALASRAVIDQALGIVMAQERCTSAQAFAILRQASQNRNVKLRDIASQIVASVSGEPPQPGPFGR
jgi:hypothetical protein